MSLRPRKVSFVKRWATLRDSFGRLLSLTEFHASASNLYSDVYDLCNAQPQPYVERLFAALQEMFDEHVVQAREHMLQYGSVLDFYGERWERFLLGASRIDELCKYLNTRLVKLANVEQIKAALDSKTVSVQAAAMSSWRTQMIEAVQRSHGDRIMHQVFEEIRRDRDGDNANLAPVAKVVHSLSFLSTFAAPGKIGVYENDFEQPFLTATRLYYSREAAHAISTLTMTEYMHHIDRRLNEETARAAVIADSSTQEKVIREVEDELIASHTERFYSECRRLVELELTDDLAKMYQLLSRLANVFKPMLKVIEDYVVEIGLKAVENLGEQAVKDPEEYVQTLVNVHSNFTTMVDKAVKGDHMFTASIDKAFRIIINDTKRHPSVKGAELLARYCDAVLKKSVKVLTDAELDDKLSKGIMLFKYVDDKDMFQKFYARLMARRLIFGTSVSDEAESSLISKLKSACGIEYTTKLQRMFTDVNISKELVDNFHATLESRADPELHVIVLTAGAWPLTQSTVTGPMVPTELERSITAFQQFYNKRFNGRKLTWLYHLSRGDVRVNYLKKRYELQLSYFQTTVLLCYNQATSYTVGELMQHTQLSDAELVRVLKSFVDIKLLTATSASLQPGTTVTLNMDFTNKRTKIKVTGAVLAETKDEVQQTHKQLDVDRQLYLQALIVRIMKTRKRLNHTLLVEQTIREASARFSPSVAMIKKVLEGLIEKAYLEREENNRDEYLYIS